MTTLEQQAMTAQSRLQIAEARAAWTRLAELRVERLEVQVRVTVTQQDISGLTALLESLKGALTHLQQASDKLQARIKELQDELKAEQAAG